MSKSGSQRLLRMTAEGAVIVVSILLAFLLDAWWDGRVESAELARELDSVRRELSENHDLVLYQVDALERIVSASDHFLEVAQASRDGSVSVSDTIAFLITSWAPTLDASFGAVDALVASSRLAAIEDEELRVGLSGLRGKVDDAVEDEIIAQDLVVEQLIPAVADRLDMEPVSRVDLAFFAGGRVTGRAIPAFVDVEFPSSMQVQNLVRYRAAWTSSALGEMRALEDEVEELISRVSGGS